MGKIVIIEEKANALIDKMESVKECMEDIIYCFTESMKGYRENDDDDDEYDDEYEVKHRRGYRSRSMGMRRGRRNNGEMSRY